MVRFTCLAFVLVTSAAFSQATPPLPPRPPNSAPAYQELRQAMPTGTGVTVKDLTLKRDQGTLHFASGSFWFFNKTSGQETGAVFQGSGSFDLSPDSASERHSLQTVLKTEQLHLEFSSAVLRFTDGTAAELRKSSAGDAAANSQANGAANNARELFRSKFHYNLEERLLADLLMAKPGAFFMAEFKSGGLLGKQYIYLVDPRGAADASPDQVALFSSGEEGDQFDIAVADRLKPGTDDAGTAEHGNADQPLVHEIKVNLEAVDTTIAKNGYLNGTTEMKFTALHDGVRELHLPLYRTLRMGSVYDADGMPLDFIQEAKDKDPQFAVILLKPLKAGQETSLTFHYEGKDLVKAAGQGNYYPEGRTSWYPAPGGTVDQYVTYDLTFRVPKDVKVVATGNKVSEKTAGDQTISIWHTKEPIAVAGFNMGRFRESEVRTPDKSLLVQAYANEELPDYLESLKLRSSFLATLNSTSMMNTALNEGNAAFQVYQDYFGPLEYDHVALTQQVACTYGQSWPMLVYLPVCYFFDATTRHVLGLDASDRTYWDNLVAHETAHQWWGQTVGFNSYRDQWMSEGFADWSASLYLKSTRKSMGDYHQFWKEQQKRVTEKNANGLRPNDVGPLSMGTRVSSSRAGAHVYQQLIYSKGAYIPHMLELMFFTNAEGSEQFKKTMRDFVSTYKNRAATTEDFKAIVEKHMPRTMDLDHNGKLDWFFNEWVYGTALPHYVVESNVITEGGSNQLHFKVTQSGVTDSFKMLVPLYLEMKDGKILRVATVSLTGNSFVEKTVSLPSTMQAKRALLNAYEDVLTD